MTDEPVRLVLTDDREPGRRAELAMPRARAEAIVHELLESCGRHYGFSIEPARRRTGPISPPAKDHRVFKWTLVLTSLEAALAFAKRYWWAIWLLALAALLVAAIYLPTAHARVYPAVAAAIVAFAMGFASRGEPTEPTVPTLPTI